MADGESKKRTRAKDKLKLKEKYDVSSQFTSFYVDGYIQWTSDASQLVCKGADGLNIVSCKDGQVVRTVTTESDEIVAFVLGLDDNTLATGHKSGLFRQWHVKDKVELIRTWKGTHSGPMSSLAFDPTTTLLASGSVDSTVKIWDIVQNYCTHTLKPTGSAGIITVVKFHPVKMNLFVFAAAMDGGIRIWDLTSATASQPIVILKKHDSAVTAFDFAIEENIMVSVGRDKTIVTWNLKDHSSIRVIPAYESLEGVALLPRATALPKLGVPDSGVHAITAGEQGALAVWDVRTGRKLHTRTVALRHSDDQYGALLGQLVLTGEQVHCVTYERVVVSHNLEDLSVSGQLVGDQGEILALALLGPEEEHVATASGSRDVRIFDISTSKCVRVLRGHEDVVLSLAVSRVNPWILASGSKDNAVFLWNAQSGHCIASATGHSADVSTVAFGWGRNESTDIVVTGSRDYCLKFWKIDKSIYDSTDEKASLKSLWTTVAHDLEVNSVCVAVNDQLVATGSYDKTAKLWCATTGTNKGILRGHRRGVTCVRFSPVDQVLATASSDGTVKLWGIAETACLKTFEGHQVSVLSLEFVSNGLQLLTSSANGLIKLWTIRTNECVDTFDNHTGNVWALTTSHDDTRAYSGGVDSKVVAWRDVTKELADAADAEREKQLQDEQTLANLVKNGKYLQALSYAIQLEQPFKCLTILKKARLECSTGVEDAVRGLSASAQAQLLRYSVQWNTNSRNCHEAQTILNIFLREKEPEDFLTGEDAKSNLEALLAYTQRHKNRMDSMYRNLSFLDYLVTSSKVASKMGKRKRDTLEIAEKRPKISEA